MKVLRFLATTLAILFIGCAGAVGEGPEAGFTVGSNVRLSRTDHMSTYEIWNSAPESTVTSGDAVAVVYAQDPEAAASEGGQELLAVVLVGQLGTGIEPVAFRITAPDTRPVRIEPRQAEANAFDLTIGDVRVPLVIQARGQVVAAGREVGTIR